MPLIPLAQRTKVTAFGSPYSSNTFCTMVEAQFCRSGPLCGLEVEQIGTNLIVQPGSVLDHGVIVEILTPQTLALPAFGTPYALYLSNTDDVHASNVTLDFTDIAGFNPLYVVIAEKTTTGAWRSYPYISNDWLTANTEGGIRARTTHEMVGGELSVAVGWPYSIHEMFFDGLLVFRDGIMQKKGLYWTQNGMKGINLAAPAGVGDIVHMFMSDDIEWVEVINVGPAQTVVPLSEPYNPDHHDLWVFKDNEGKQRDPDHYSETNTTTVTLNVAPGIATDYMFIKFKHNYWKERIVLAGPTALQTYANVYDPSRADISVFHSPSAAAAGVLLNQGSAHDYTELSGEEISLVSGQLFPGGAAGDILEVYRHRTGIPKGIGYFMAEGFGATPPPVPSSGDCYEFWSAVGGSFEVFTLMDCSYTMGNNSFEIFRNGKKLVQGLGFNELTTTTFNILTTVATDEISAQIRGTQVGAHPGLYSQQNAASTGLAVVYTVPLYTTGIDAMRVWRNGKLLSISNGDYTESSGTSVTIASQIIGDEFEFVIRAENASGAPLLFEEFVALGAVNESFTLAGTYNVGTDTLEVYRQGKKLEDGLGYSEVGASQVQYIGTTTAGDLFTFLVRAQS